MPFLDYSREERGEIVPAMTSEGKEEAIETEDENSVRG
jgi:hypothetical protein